MPVMILGGDRFPYCTAVLGWPSDPDTKDDERRSINLGNTCTKEQFDVICAQLYKLLVVFLDVRMTDDT